MSASGQVPAAPSATETGWVGIVDDDASIRTSLARAFHCNGIRVETFGSAEEYLARSGLDLPSCIVLDVHLGRMSGPDLQRRLAREGCTVPIIFITAHEQVDVDCRGARGFLRKPFDTNVLIALVRPHLSRSPST
jgi:FixJ family two-component response regulator